ncbi:MAG: hypothetical protein D4S01_04430, partial [Dehalococcoidia bacterium]
MSRPTIQPIDRSDVDWLTNLTANFSILFDGPFPIEDDPTVFNAKLYKDCWGVSSGQLYFSDGITWYAKQLDNIPDLNPATALLSDIV